MSEATKGLRNKFVKWREALEIKRLKVNPQKTKVSSDLTQDGLSKTNVGLCLVCSLRVKANSVLCVVW